MVGLQVPAGGGVLNNNGRKREMMVVVMRLGKKWWGGSGRISEVVLGCWVEWCTCEKKGTSEGKINLLFM